VVSVHRECGDAWDWRHLANAAPPPVPDPRNQHESAANDALRAYKPGFFDRLFGADKKRIASLEAALLEARAADRAEHDEALRQHRSAHATWSLRRNLALRIEAKNVTAYTQALEHAAAFDEISSFGTDVRVAATMSDAIAFTCEMTNGEIIPAEELKLTSTGKLTTKTMPANRYWGLYQDHVCSCALRIAAETFAVVPVSRVIVNMGTLRNNPSTGHQEFATFLAAHFARGTLRKLNLTNVDPSDSMKNFPYRMKFKKTSGFDPVRPITLDEEWVTT